MPDDPTPPAPPAETPTGAPAAPAAPTPSAPATPEPGTTEPKDTDWKSEARKWEQRAKDNKTAGEQSAQQLAAVLKALGKNPDGTDAPADPVALAKQVNDYKATAWENATQVAILRICAKPEIGADADALLDSNSFLDSLAEFVDDDPNTAEFLTKLAKHIKDFVGKNHKFKATPAVPARSGGEFPGGSGTGTPISEDQLSKMTPTEITKAYNEGRLKHLM